MDKELRCYTCSGTQAECPGHFGHIELAQPVYHAGMLEYIRKILRCVCFNCSLLLLDKEHREPLLSIKNNQFRFQRCLKLCESANKRCSEGDGGCGYMQPKYTKSGLSIVIDYQDPSYDQSRDKKQRLQPDEALKVLQRITQEDCHVLGFDPTISRPENMIIKNLAVAPPPVRPSVAMSSTNRSEDDLTYAYQQILKINIQLNTHMRRGANQTTINELRTSLQYYVATLMDNEIQGQPTQKHKSGKALKAIRARLRGKEGRLRGNLMGKRVDFSSRSVITPDPNLQLDQLGVPKQIALNLTIPEIVTSENIDEMRRLVNNGPNNWPGAKYIIRHDDKQIDLGSLKNRSDAHLEPGFKVERHLRNDDYVIFNRQPSLHKMSLMGHRVKVLPYSTFRLNLSVTTPYNADFDGDEMNMHVPQSYETKAEIKEIMAVPNQIVSPKDNKPVMGIVQDALLGVMLFTLRDTFIDKEQVMNLMMWVGYDEKFPTPAILKPKPLWTGKQIFSLIIPKINLSRYNGDLKKNGFDKSKGAGVSGQWWADHADRNLYIREGELLCGNLNKSNIGSSSGGIIHIIWKDKGPYPTRDFMSNTQLLINNWLHQNGFTVGVQDIIAQKTTLDMIKDELKKMQVKMDQVVTNSQIGKLEQQPGKNMMETFEFDVNRILNEARDLAGDIALKNLYTWNRLKAMVTAGSKGSNLNISQIMACVGQQNVEGKRIPFGFHQRSLPHFSKDDFGAESKGFVSNCYLTGLTPSEFFFHAMGGREGLIDTAVKTAETGYIQRRLIKALEDIMVKYDGTVRTSKEQVIQFLYGEDGMAGEHIEDLRIELLGLDNNEIEKQYNLIPQGMSSVEVERNLSQALDPYSARSIVEDPNLTLKLKEEFNQILRDRDDLRQVILKDNPEVHLAVNIPRIIWNAKETFKIKPNSRSDLHPSHVIESIHRLSDDLCAIPGINVRRDPLLLQAKENSTWLFKIYLRSLLSSKKAIMEERLSKSAFDFIIGEIKSKFDQAISNPGEMIGSIAAQSIGEPATQMTLNTFHNAGVSSKNVTLGVPRLKEIINVAKNIKTPSMKIYLQEELKKNKLAVQEFSTEIEHTTLGSVVKNAEIYYDPDDKRTIVKEDEELLQLYYEVPIEDDRENVEYPPWLLRFVFDNEKINYKHISMEQIEAKLNERFAGTFKIIRSDDNMDNLVMRIRVLGFEDDGTDSDETFTQKLKGLQDQLLALTTLKGIPEITKVSFTEYKQTTYVPETGSQKDDDKNFLIETDGVALARVLGKEKVDSKRTSCNHIYEILKVLGIEAVRLSLIIELRFVLSTYGIYINYRHLSTLCDVMTQRGILTAITRHGINRVDTGPLRKCSFEETVEILYEAAVFSEIDKLSGITENIIMGQLAPYGTGSFDLVVDTNILNTFAQAKFDEEPDVPMSGGTPFMHENNGGGDQFIGTPIQGQTPVPGAFNNIGSEYSIYGTPGYGPGGMSPGPGQAYGQSPAYTPQYAQSPNPQYGQSPIYRGAQSPIYQTIGMSPAASASPGYSPTNSRQTPVYQSSVMTPAYVSGSQQVSTPVYNYGAQRSMPVSTSSNAPPSSGGYVSATYSPTTYNNPISNSPRYSPTTPNYSRTGGMTSTPAGGVPAYSPQYSPTSNVYGTAQGSASPRYQVQSASPRYIPAGASSHQTPSGTSPGNPNGSMYIPSSPVYNPLSSGAPQMSRPAYQGGNTQGGGGVSPIDDDDLQK